MALERAWGHWRVMHGLGTDPLPPVSSYVGYSLEEPWGQPRVVFGVGAEEAERLAALLAGHDCVGPVHAEVTARPDWRLAASGGPETGQGRPFEGAVSVPAQAPPPGAEPTVERDAGHLAATAAAAGGDPASTGMAERYIADAAYDDIVEAEDARAGSYDDEPIAMDRTVAGGDRTDEDEAAAGISPRRWRRGEQAGIVQLGADEQPEVIAFRRRPEQRADQWQEPTSPAAPASDDYAASPNQGPGYRGPRYQGDPPQYQPGPDLQDPPALFGTRPQDRSEPTDESLPSVGEPGAGEPSARQQKAVEGGARESGVSESSAGQATARQPQVARADAEQSGASQPSAVRAKAAESRAAQPATVPPATVPPATVRPATVPPATVPPATVPPATVQPATVRPATVQPATVPPATVRPATVQSEAGLSEAVPSDAGQPGGQAEAGRPRAGRPRAGQSKPGQSRAGQSRAGQSKAGQSKPDQSKAEQSMAGQSKPGQPRQTSRPSSPGRASGREPGKRPRG
jgi:hypothetical protein